MNILPLICGLLIVFSCLAFTFMKEQRAITLIEKSLLAAARTERAVMNKIQERHFRKVKPLPQEKKTPVKEQKKQPRYETFINLRRIFPPPEKAKLSLSPLFKEHADLSENLIYQTALNLLSLLYQSTPIVNGQKPGWEKRILDEVISKERSLSELDSLSDLFPKDPALKTLYYKMLKGTNDYDVEAKRGVPPLGDFFTIDEDKKGNTVYFSFAPPVLLKALFGESIANAILTAEQQELAQTHKFQWLTKEELQAILLQHRSPKAQFSLYEPYVNFSKQIPVKKNIAGQDAQTHLIIKRKC